MQRFGRLATSIGRLLMGLALACVIVGCAQPVQRSAPTSLATSDWSFNGQTGRVVRTGHYQIHTTINDDAFVESLAGVMEGALLEYQQFAPGVTPSAEPMDCYVFSRRSEWARFTAEHTGEDAAVYLQINRGGYTVRDWFVAYNIGDVGTWAVAAHEGFHQYVARNFKSRLPPFLEEGIATMFENIRWSGDTPYWDLDVNPNRADKLRVAIEDRNLWPLEKLCTMHAGDVVGLSGERIETFYAQNWAFAQFLWAGNNGRHRPAMQRMLSDLASGQADAVMGRKRGSMESWDPRSVRPLLEHYFGQDIAAIDADYQSFIRQIAHGSRDLRPPPR